MIWELAGEKNQFEGKLSNFILVDGSFDPLHDGHISYFRAAASMGLKVACLISPEAYTRKKHPILLEKTKRAILLDSIKYIDIVILAEISTGEAILILRPNIFFKGGDWEGKLSKEIVDSCKKVNCEIKFGPMPTNSSSSLLESLVCESKLF